MRMSWVLALFAAAAPAFADAPCSKLLDFRAEKLRSKEMINVCESFKGRVILAVNTASQCGYTPQFKGLEALYQKYKDRGFVVLGFPSDDFRQEYDDPAKTAQVCYLNYGVTFPMFASSPVTGDNANAFFKLLAEGTGQQPEWNFYKYLIDREGRVRDVFPSKVTPESPELQGRVEALISAPPALTQR